MKEIHIVVQFYNDRDPERNAENEHCLWENLENPYISKVHVLLEEKTILPENFKGHPKCIVGPSTGNIRLTFKTALLYAESVLQEQDFVGLINSDIILDKNSPWNTLDQVFDVNPGKIAVALSRYELNAEGQYWQAPDIFVGWSQDMWILQKRQGLPLVPQRMLEKMDFCVGGAPRCDNYFVVLARFWGHFDVINPASEFKIFHFDRCRGHSGGGMIFTSQTDYRARDAMNPLVSILGHVDNACPFIDWRSFFQKDSNFPFNKIGNCWKRSPHQHHLDGTVTEDFPLLENSLKDIWKGIWSSTVVAEERKTMAIIASKIMVEKQCFFEPPISKGPQETERWEKEIPDAAFLLAHWANHLRCKGQSHEALPIILRACQCEWDESTCKEKEIYEYFRWHVLGIIGWYANDKVQGKLGAERALEARGRDVDRTNLQFYLSTNQ